MLVEGLLVAIVTALGVRPLGLRRRDAGLLLGAMLLAATWLALATSSSGRVAAPTPLSLGAANFATSNACRSCHPGQYSSWHDSFHRRMTQPARVENIAAAELRQGGRLRIETGGRTVELFLRDAQLWARLPDPSLTSAVAGSEYEDVFRAAPSRDVPVQLLTGSHHHQAFWVSGARQGELRALPAVFSIDEQRLLPRRDAFLNPPSALEQAVRWNSNCVQCHAVAGEPRHQLQRDVFESSAAELGIACEACHGAGAEHVRAMQNPVTRYLAHAQKAPSGMPVNPSKLGAERGSQVCGRCHSYFFPKQETEWWEHGFARSYAPGGDLNRAQLLLSPQILSAPNAPKLGAEAQSLFYADGTIRVGGREYNGLVRSPCFERGHGDRQLSCTSCHSLHAGAADDQLDPEKLGNGACTQCHSAQKKNVSAHTHHAASSPGSLCYNCHMPHTSYALLGAIRSHRVASPTFDRATEDRPNACNLCHLERSESWAAERATAWFGAKPRFTLHRVPALLDAQLPAGAAFALAGDAAVRAITAAALGRHESSTDAAELRQELLRVLADDEYAAVRQIAARQLQQKPHAAVLSQDTVQRLLAMRDNRPVTIAE